ncbi:MAG: hypothetical protein IJX80_00565 [Clostridia bacterium]|nr:hypothetical protein [Clostridia bacterium]
MKKVLILGATGAMDCEATMSRAGDVTRMLAAILFNPTAFGAACPHRMQRGGQPPYG